MSKRAQVILPIDVLANIDKLVGKQGRSEFITEVAREEIQRSQQQNALLAANKAWKGDDHPELKDGSSTWVRQIRSVIIDAINGQRGCNQLLADILSQRNLPACCSIHVAEVYTGMRARDRGVIAELQILRSDLGHCAAR